MQFSLLFWRVLMFNKFRCKIFLYSTVLILCLIVNGVKVHGQDDTKNANKLKNFIQDGNSIIDTVFLAKDHVLLVVDDKNNLVDDNSNPYSRKGYLLMMLKKQSRGNFVNIGSTRTTSLGSNCPANGFIGIVSKGIFFTIEDSFCDGWLFVWSFTTFKYDESLKKYMLYKYSQTYSDRTDPDKNIPTDHYKVEGNFSFEDVTQDFLSDLINGEI